MTETDRWALWNEWYDEEHPEADYVTRAESYAVAFRPGPTAWMSLVKWLKRKETGQC